MNYNLPPVITLDVRTIEKLCECAALRAVGKFAESMGMEGKEISERAAFRKFNESRIKQWVREGRLTYRRLTDSERSKKMYKVIDIMNLILATEDGELKAK